MKPLNDRRSDEDRRETQPASSPPLRNRNDTLATIERCYFHKREMGSIKLAACTMSKEEFDEYFKNFQEDPVL